MRSYTRSEFLRLSTMGTLGLLTSRGMALPPGYSGIPSGIRPYLHAMRPDSIWVSWFSNSASSGTVEWGTSSGSLGYSLNVSTDTSLGVGYYYHTGRITGLQPNTYYYYRVRNGSVMSDVFRFRTPVADGTKSGFLRVLVAGDNQTYTSERRHEMLMACAKYKIEQLYGVPIEEAIDFVLTTGDQVDRGVKLHYRDLHFRFNGLVSPNLPIMTTVGNHELYDDPNLVNYRKLFRYPDVNYAGIVSPEPQLYYAYKVGSVCFIHTSSEPEHLGPAQNTWLRQLVDALKADVTTDLCVSVAHRPYKAAQAIGDTSAWFANQIMPMLAETEKHVLTISGHHHYYDRGQTKNWPIYHMISGGTASYQNWSQFNYDYEAPYDEVQKTVFNWAWQILEFDLNNRTMEVRCFTETNGNLAESTRWTTQGYNSRLIDSFHRRLGVPAPDKPALANAFAAPLAHPVWLTSSAFSAPSTEALNSTWFQVATDAGFANLKLDRLRDVEKIYGDTGWPRLEPVNVHDRLDILTCKVPASLPNGTYYARVRHRDTNAMWSAWSDVRTFQINSSASGTRLSMQKSSYVPREDIVVNYENGPGNDGDWIGIFRKGDTPGSAASATSQYTNGTSGSRLFVNHLSGGEWFAAFVANNGYTELASRVPFYLGDVVALAPSKPNYAEGEPVRLDFGGAPGGSKDWISIYRVGQEPGVNASVAWQYSAATSGFLDLAGISKGYYYAVFMVDDGYQEVSARVRFSVGSLISQVTMSSTRVGVGEAITVGFSTAPGLSKDWIGLYRLGDVPGQQAPVQRLYFDGNLSGQVTFEPPELPAGSYWVAMFTDDTFIEVSSRWQFEVVPLAIEEIRAEHGQVHLRWKSVPGDSYTVQRSPGLNPADWSDVQTVIASGDVQELVLPIASGSRRGFFRVRRN